MLMLPTRSHAHRWARHRRKLRKLYKQIQIRCVNTTAAFSIVLSIVVLVLGLIFLSKCLRSVSEKEDLSVTLETALSVTRRSTFQILSEEAHLTSEYICKRTSLPNEIQKLTFCGSFPSNAEKKIIGLVEVRNVERSIAPFLSALSEVVDSIVIVDDHSSDSSRNQILQYNALHSPDKPVVEVLLNKTGDWIREELADRELLLTTGRHVGGTHFVLLDYDEFFSADCMQNGRLRDSILALNPGESLYLPWIEVWKSLFVQRVHPTDPNMNFLVRRQLVIFADDLTSHYTQESATARVLGSHSRNSTLHVLRCPRSICPKLAKYRGPASSTTDDPRVKQLPACSIIELRFLNMNNVLLKSVWYEALGRVMGAVDGITSGKMIEKLFPQHGTNEESLGSSHLLNVSPKLVGTHIIAAAKVLGLVELWRAEELLRWMNFSGKATFLQLPILSLLDTDELRTLVHQARAQPQSPVYHVPRLKERTLVVSLDQSRRNLLDNFLSLTKFTRLSLEAELQGFPSSLSQLDHERQEVTLERWKGVLQTKLQTSLQLSPTSRIFVSLPEKHFSVFEAVVDVLRLELPDVDIVIIATKHESHSGTGDTLAKSRDLALELGSHIRFLQFPAENFGSYAALHWLKTRLIEEPIDVFEARNMERALLDLAETLHTENDATISTIAPLRYAAVARAIFSLNVGRSGSKYLADAIKTIDGLVLSLHEPSCPDGSCSGGGALRMQNRSLISSYDERRMIKLPMIRQSLIDIARNKTGEISRTQTVDCNILTDWKEGRRTADHGVPLQPVFEVSSRSRCVRHSLQYITYAETNPNFKSWIYDVALDFFPMAGYDVRVVVLRKYVAALLKSLYETGYFSVRDGYNWMETAAGVNTRAKLQSLSSDLSLSAYDKILSYLTNSEAVFEHVVERYGDHGGHATLPRRVRFLEMRSERLYTPEGTLEALRWLGLQPSERTVSLTGTIRDKYVQGTSKKLGETSIAECERRVEHFLNSITDPRESAIVRNLFGRLAKVADYEYPP